MELAGAAEARRIAEQHKYITSGLGFHVHPTIQSALTDNGSPRRIADISLGSQFEDSENIGITCSGIHFEPFSFDTILSSGGIGPSHAGQYDLVAVRLLHENLKPDQWDTVLQNLLKLLKRGGWIHWIDWDPVTPRIAGAKPGQSDSALRELFHAYSDTLRSNKVGTTYKISAAFTSDGLEECDSDMYALNPEVAFTRNIATGALNYLRRDGSMNTGNLDRLEKEVDDEIRNGTPLLWYDLWCHIGKKPVNPEGEAQLPYR